MRKSKKEFLARSLVKIVNDLINILGDSVMAQSEENVKGTTSSRINRTPLSHSTINKLCLSILIAFFFFHPQSWNAKKPRWSSLTIRVWCEKFSEKSSNIAFQLELYVIARPGGEGIKFHFKCWAKTKSKTKA
jgi:hypothetical protein